MEKGGRQRHTWRMPRDDGKDGSYIAESKEMPKFACKTTKTEEEESFLYKLQKEHADTAYTFDFQLLASVTMKQ